MILIPAIDIKGGRCVRLLQGDMNSETVYAEDPLSVARAWERQGAQALHIVDLDGAVMGKPVHDSLIGEIIQGVGIPVQIGGGIRSLAWVENYLRAGAAYVILGTSALENIALVKEASHQFPGKVIVGIDSKKGAVAISGWITLSTQSVTEIALRLCDIGVAAIILTDIEKDGMLSGPNMTLFEDIALRVKIPMIASGGITTLDQIQQISKIPGMIGAIVGKALYTGAILLPEALALLNPSKKREADMGIRPVG